VTREVVYGRVACPLCGARMPVAELADHLEICREREHPTQERFE